MSKQYGLSKQESDRLATLLSVAQVQQEIFNAVTERYKNYLINEVFKRLDVKPEAFEHSKINLGEGTLIVDEPKKKKEPEKKEEKKA